jgi:hypothetical protein
VALLVSRREQLAREFAELQSDLGGLVYEMAMRDEFRTELVARQAAKLQAVDLELSAVERALGIAASDPGSKCPACGTPAPIDAAFCGRCGAPLRSLHPPQPARAAAQAQPPAQAPPTTPPRPEAEGAPARPVAAPDQPAGPRPVPPETSRAAAAADAPTRVTPAPTPGQPSSRPAEGGSR